jgi:hypothetical protein
MYLFNDDAGSSDYLVSNKINDKRTERMWKIAAIVYLKKEILTWTDLINPQNISVTIASLLVGI